MDQESLHLTDAQIEQYGNTSSATGPEAGQQVEMHLADCPACRSRVLVSQRTRFALMGDSPVNTASHSNRSGPQCPSEDDLRNLAAGLCPPNQATKLTEHAAQCDHCGPLLRMYAEDFSDELGKEDEAVLGKLKSSSAGWQKKLARQMTAASDTAPMKSARKPFFRTWVLVATAATACAVAFIVWYSQRETPEKVEKLLAQAYTEPRQIELRFPGAEWAPVRVPRGPEDSRFSKPTSLLRAENIISDRQSKDPNNVEWLKARGEAEIIEKQPEAAIATLNKALEAQPESTSLMLDSAIAYFVQAERSHDHQGYLQTIDLLSKIIQKEPRNQAALFNLALTYTRTEMWDQAVPAWEAYLGVDGNGPWAQEAKEKLALARSKVHASLQRSPDPSLDASSFLMISDDAAEYNSEHYLDVALQNWIGRAVAHPESADYRATLRLAQIMSGKHSDSWLKDFLGPRGTRDPTGASALSAAITENSNGHYAEAVKKALRAERFFKGQHNLPGELRARYESVYVSQRLLHGAECLARADPLEKAAASTTYHWLQSQLAMERAICLNFVSSLSDSDSELSHSLDIANRFHFPILTLRSIGISQGLEIQQGRYDAAWRAGIRGLTGYWTSPSSVQRIYQFYVCLALAAEHMGLWAAADTLQTHAIRILEEQKDEDKDGILIGAARLELARILIAEKQDSTAESELVKANLLFDREPGEPTARSYLMVGQIGLAELQFKRGRLSQALSMLAPARELVSETDRNFVSLRYYQLSGNISLQFKQLDRAAEAYKLAIVIVENSLGGIKSDHERLQWIQAADGAYRGLVRVFIEQHRKEEDPLKLWEWYESRPSQENTTAAARLVKGATTSWEKIWANAPEVSGHEDNTVRIVYAVFSDGVQIWTIGKGPPSTTWVPIAREQLEKMVQQFSQSCARPDSPLAELQQQGQNLFRILLEPVIARLQTSSVFVIELDRSLAGLPVEALWSPNGWYFGEKYPVIYSPGIMREAKPHSPNEAGSSQSLLLVDTSGAGGTYLPGDEMEREAISKLFPKIEILSSQDASLAKMQAFLASSDAFVFIGHGERNGSGTALRFNEELLVQADDFPPKILTRMRLVVLAACATGSGIDGGLLDNRNLVHAFLAGNVPNVVASNWNVDSEATGELMRAFYTHLASGEPSVMAMFAARNEVLKIRIHPYFWSAFSVIGKASEK